MGIRSVPWIVAAVGLALLLVVSSFRVWALVAVLLPVLFLLAFEGGWWLIPADLAWLVIELLDLRRGGAEASRAG